MYKEIVKARLVQSIHVKEQILNNAEILAAMDAAIKETVKSLANGGTLFTCGNGGSASDSLHVAGELLGRFQLERKGYAAVALNSDVATITAIANDYGYEHIFARQLEGLMHSGDVLLAFSTSGNSTNIVRAVEMVKQKNGISVVFSGRDGGALRGLANVSVIIPSENTARIQETHMCLYHTFCELVEKELSDLQ